jgi:hypothetical protein
MPRPPAGTRSGSKGNRENWHKERTTVANGDVPDGSKARDGSGGEGEEAVWLDLVARYDAPVPAEGDAVPWPDREDLASPAVPVPPSDTQPLPEAPEAPSGPVPSGQPWTRAPGAAGGAGPGDAVKPGSTAKPGDIAKPGAAGPGSAPRPSGPRDSPRPEVPADEHYIPPPAPPLPKIDAVTKGAWLALFGGPLYLIIATACGWTVSGLAAFIAVAAFVGGFAVLVLRMDSGPPRDRGPDDGAVV